MGHSFTQSFTRLAHTFFIYVNELITKGTAREYKTQPSVIANVEAKDDSFSFLKIV